MDKRKCEEGLTYVPPEKQYKDINLDDVTAQYIRSQNPLYQGNPFIEALPLPREVDECIKDYTLPVPGFSRTAVENMTDSECLRQVHNIREFRVPLPYNILLENNIYRAICSGYKNKYQIATNTPDNEEGSKALLWNEPITDACIGFTLLGHAGCGKTSSLKLALSRIPQIIRHKNLESNFVQIPYLFVTCSAHSNIKGLMSAIGRNLDIVLGYTDGRYETKISSKRTIDQISQVVQDIIEAFGIGIIIFDEIQEMDFNHLNKNSFHPMLTISERCKIAFGYIGTEEAIDKLTKDEYISRRAGTPIHADAYAADRNSFARIFNAMQTYQWLKTPCYFNLSHNGNEFQDPFIEKFFQYSGGIVNRMVTLFIYLQMDAIQKKSTINESLLDSIIDRDFQDLKILIQKKSSKKNIARVEKIFENANAKLKSSSEEQAQKEFEDYLEMKCSSEIPYSKQILFDKVYDNICICGLKYTKDQVFKACESVYEKKKNQGLTDRDFTPLVTEKLSKTVKKSKKTSKVASSVIQSNLDIAMAVGKELF